MGGTDQRLKDDTQVMSPSLYVHPLSEARDLNEVGGKAYSLWRMLGQELSVPEGFVVTNRAFNDFLREDGRGAQIAQWQEGLRPENLAAIEEASRRIQALVRGAEISSSLRAELAGLCEQSFRGEVIIVRSSAVGEDSGQASFAGQLDSILDVRTEEELSRALLSCWASYWSVRALAYQLSRGIALQGMGVILQRQVHSQLAGVLFTQDPGDRGRQQMVGEYCYGQGEALVSGKINPGSFTVSRRDGTWRKIASPEQQGGGGEDERLLFAPAPLAALHRAGLMLEERLGGPQDIEWAIDASGALYFVQSRPITAFARAAPGAAPTGARRLILWSNANINENFPDPVTPLLYSIASVGYYHYFRNLGLASGVSPGRVQQMEHPLRNLIGAHGARLYYNLTHIHDVLGVAPYGDLLADYFDHFVGATSMATVEPPRESAGSRVSGALELVTIALKTGHLYLDLSERVREFEETVDAFAAQCHPRLLPSKSLAELLADLRGFLDIRCHRWTNAALADAASMVCFGVLKGLLHDAFPAPEQHALHGTLLKGLPNLVSSAPVDDLWTLSRLIREDPVLVEAFATRGEEDLLAFIQSGRFPEPARALEACLERWGYRGSGELMLTVPSFQEEPWRLLQVVKGYLGLEGTPPGDELARQSAEREAATARVLAEFERRRLVPIAPYPSQARLFSTVLAWTQTAITCRERARFKQSLLYARLRRIVLAIGERLTASGRLARREDVFFLAYQELEALLVGSAMFPSGVRDLVDLRRRQHEELCRMRPPDRFTLEEGESLAPTDLSGQSSAEEEAFGGGELTGVGTCGGRISARAAVMQDVSESHRLAPGDILITRQTDPGWAPVFFLIKGLVMERGGMLSHGSILAREFGIPSVVGVKDATLRIRQGQTVTLDGDRGLVQPVD